MLMPTMRTNVFDDLFNNPFFTKSESSMMKTDIKEHDNCYDLMIDLPGVKKEDIKAELNDGYLTVSAESNTSKDEKDDKLSVDELPVYEQPRSCHGDVRVQRELGNFPRNKRYHLLGEAEFHVLRAPCQRDDRHKHLLKARAAVHLDVRPPAATETLVIREHGVAVLIRGERYMWVGIRRAAPAAVLTVLVKLYIRRGLVPVTHCKSARAVVGHDDSLFHRVVLH